MIFIDIHSHNICHDKDVITILNINLYTDDVSTPYSIGLHPWDNNSTDDLNIIRQKIFSALALGECGLDKTKGSDILSQKNIFIKQLNIAQQFNKPVIIHCVKSYGSLLEIKNNFDTSTPWIIHGFQSSLEWLKAANKYDFYFSLGPHQLSSNRANELINNIPLDKLFLETDDSKKNIKEVYNIAAQLLHINVDTLKSQIEKNFSSVFSAFTLNDVIPN